MIKASVIIPVYNREKLITRCLDSIALQTYPNMEVIVVDNASTDSSRETVSHWISAHKSDIGKSYTLVGCPEPGAAAARDAGAKLAQGEILFFFDSDDAMRPSYVSDAMLEFESHPETDIVGWRILFHNLDGSLRSSHAWTPGMAINDHLINAVLRTQGYACRKEFHFKAGGWNHSMPVWDDWELGLRLLLHSPRIRVLDKIQADVYCQAESITGSSFSAKAGLWEKAIDSMEGDTLHSSHPDKDHILRLLAYRRAILAAWYLREGRRDFARPLLDRVFKEPDISPFRRFLLRFAYNYTRRGGRGAYRIIGRFL